LKLYHKIYGKGEVVVILHGLFGMSDNWKTIARHLSDTFTVVTIDLPNHGKSPRLDSFNLDDVADALHEFLSDNWMYDIRLIGHSLGGKVAMTFAQRYPDMVEQLVSIDIGPQAYKSGHQAIFDALFELDVDQLSSRQAAEEKLSQSISDAGTRLFLLKNLKRVDGGFAWKFDLLTLHRDYENILVPMSTQDVFESPTLFVKGGASSYIDFDTHGNLIRSIFPAAEMKTIANAGHWVHADAPDELENMLRDFLV